jgi:hypothetical protein
MLPVLCVSFRVTSGHAPNLFPRFCSRFEFRSHSDDGVRTNNICSTYCSPAACVLKRTSSPVQSSCMLVVTDGLAHILTYSPTHSYNGNASLHSQTCLAAQQQVRFVQLLVGLARYFARVLLDERNNASHEYHSISTSWPRIILFYQHINNTNKYKCSINSNTKFSADSSTCYTHSRQYQYQYKE